MIKLTAAETGGLMSIVEITEPVGRVKPDRALQSAVRLSCAQWRIVVSALGL